MTDFAIDECCACLREAIVPAGVVGGEIRLGVYVAGGVGGVQVTGICVPTRLGEMYEAPVDRNGAGRCEGGSGIGEAVGTLVGNS